MNTNLFQKNQHYEKTPTNGERPDGDDSSATDVETMIVLLKMVTEILEKHRE